MARIRARIAETAPEDARLRVLLVLAHEVLRLREQESAAERLYADASDPAPWTPPIPGASKQEYARLIPRIRELVGALVPSGASVLVTSRGDDALLDLPGVKGAHFPQEKRGAWAGFHPADSESAIVHLEALRAEGAEFILFPGTAYWWFDYYGELSRHLLTRSRVVHHDDDCVIFDLRVGDGQAAA